MGARRCSTVALEAAPVNRMSQVSSCYAEQPDSCLYASVTGLRVEESSPQGLTNLLAFSASAKNLIGNPEKPPAQLFYSHLACETAGHRRAFPQPQVQLPTKLFCGPR